jgi:hypothetical protein
MAGCCEHGNEPSGSIKGGEFLDQLNVQQRLCSVELWSWLSLALNVKIY